MKSILLTGVTSGIGSVVLRYCVDDGLQVSVFVRSQKQASDLELMYPGIEVFVCELSDRDQLSVVLEKLKSRTFDFVFLNAGFGDIDQFHKLPEDSIGRTIEVNLLANMRIVHALLPGALPNRTKFVFTSSLAARFPGSKYASYGVSKAGLSHFHHSLHVEYPRLPLLLLEIGGVATPLHKKSNFDIDQRKLKSQEIIGKRVFNAIKKRTGVKTLALDWFVFRRLSFLFPNSTFKFPRRFRRWKKS